MRASFAADHADRLAARRQFPAHQLLDGERVGDVVRERREVIQPVRVGDELVVLHVLRDLFVAAMQIADIRRRLGDHLAIQFEHQPQDAVRGRVRRAHVEDHLFAEIVARLRICLRLHGCGRAGRVLRFRGLRKAWNAVNARNAASPRKQ